jgi:FemAB-related protein (PEP-CTERM system-associated)
MSVVGQYHDCVARTDDSRPSAEPALVIERCGDDFAATLPRSSHPADDARWTQVLKSGLGHRVYWLTARSGNISHGHLPLAFVASRLFGRFLVSLPYVNAAGVRSTNWNAQQRMIDDAAALADELDCRYLELRHESAIEHARLTHERTDKCLMRLALPESEALLWEQLKAKVRNQVRKGQRPGFRVCWGRFDQLDSFYFVFARTMRDLGTPVFGRRLFDSILNTFGNDAELCVVYDAWKPVAGALLVHGTEVTEVPSASALHDYHPTNVNMLMYWNLLSRAIERGSHTFDFGRSTLNGGTYQFKKQWGAEPYPSVWQYYVRRGSMDALRPDYAGNRKLIALWKRMPVWLTRTIGPTIVRGIP